jgi:sporulation protein YlmC with PRC-barrel domain
VLSLSRVTGQDVLGPDGRALGRLADMTVQLGEQAGPHLVERLLVRRHRGQDLLMPWAAIESFENTGVLVHGTDDPTSFAITSTTDALGDDDTGQSEKEATGDHGSHGNNFRRAVKRRHIEQRDEDDGLLEGCTKRLDARRLATGPGHHGRPHDGDGRNPSARGHGN